MLLIHNISIMMWILYIDRQQYWKWTLNAGATAHVTRTVFENSHKWQTWQSLPILSFMWGALIVDCFTVTLRLLLLHCICCLKLYMTLLRWLFFLCVCVCVCVCVGGGGGGGGHSSAVYLVFGAVYWSRPPRVLRRLTALLFSHLVISSRYELKQFIRVTNTCGSVIVQLLTYKYNIK